MLEKLVDEILTRDIENFEKKVSSPKCHPMIRLALWEIEREKLIEYILSKDEEFGFSPPQERIVIFAYSYHDAPAVERDRPPANGRPFSLAFLPFLC